jgi:hypothetical protein
MLARLSVLILDGEIRKFRIANKSETAQRFATSCGSQFDE